MFRPLKVCLCIFPLKPRWGTPTAYATPALPWFVTASQEEQEEEISQTQIVPEISTSDNDLSSPETKKKRIDVSDFENEADFYTKADWSLTNERLEQQHVSEDSVFGPSVLVSPRAAPKTPVTKPWWAKTEGYDPRNFYPHSSAGRANEFFPRSYGKLKDLTDDAFESKIEEEVAQRSGTETLTEELTDLPHKPSSLSKAKKKGGFPSL